MNIVGEFEGGLSARLQVGCEWVVGGEANSQKGGQSCSIH